MVTTPTANPAATGTPSPTITAARRARERAARRTAILDAAQRLFESRGIEATTIDEIARACEVAKGTVYLSFGSKDEIAFALLMRATRALYEALHGALDPHLPAVAQLTRVAITYQEFAASRPHAFDYMFVVPHPDYAGRIAPELLEEFAALGRATLDLVAGLLEQAHEEGELDVPDPRSTAVALWSAVTGAIVVPRQESRRPFLGPVDGTRLARETGQILLRGLQPDPAINTAGRDARRQQQHHPHEKEE